MRVLELVGSDVPVRQGDLLSFSEDFSRPYSCPAAVVLTADCDLAGSKHYGQLLLCPIVPIAAYMRDEWAKRRLRKMKQDAIKRLLLELGQIKSLSGEGGISKGVVEAISLSATTMQAALSSVSISEQARGKIMKQVRICVECSDLSVDPYQALLRATAQRDDCDLAKATQAIRSDFRQEMKSDNNDVVAFPDESYGPTSASVVLLRCPFSVLTCDLSFVRDVETPISRIGRLCMPMKYLIAQKFGFLFARFGMPASLEEDRNVAVELQDLGE